MKMLLTSSVILALAAGALYFEERLGMLSAGDVAPDFSARLPSGEIFSLSTFRGKNAVVLYFYPRDFTEGCTAQACSFRDNRSRIEREGAVLVGVSSDGAGSHEKFSDRYALGFPLVSDSTSAIAKAYGVRRLGGLIPMNKRVTYVIDKLGVIRLVSHHEINIGLHQTDVLSSLQSLGRQ